MQKNTYRIIPTKADFMKDKKINDIIYSFYQTHSYLTKDNIRYCYKKDVSAKKIIEYYNSIDTKCPVSERTIRNVNKLLISINVFKESEIDKKKVYLLPDQISGQYIFIKTNTLQYLVDTANTNVIKVYAYLKMKWQQHIDMNFKEKYRFTKAELLEQIGYSKNNTDNLNMITNILNSLVNNGLINISQTWTTTTRDNITQYYVLDAVKEDYTESIEISHSEKVSQVAIPDTVFKF